MTKQEYYDLLVDSAKSGVFPGYADGSCVYRADDGRKCAVGVLLSDSDMAMISNTCSIVSIPDHIVKRILPDGMCDYQLSCVQDCHDNVAAGGWNTDQFLRSINRLDIFADVKKEVIGD